MKRGKDNVWFKTECWKCGRQNGRRSQEHGAKGRSANSLGASQLHCYYSNNGYTMHNAAHTNVWLKHSAPG
eukprot:6490440-Amphidinium_carterae.1